MTSQQQQVFPYQPGRRKKGTDPEGPLARSNQLVPVGTGWVNHRWSGSNLKGNKHMHFKQTRGMWLKMILFSILTGLSFFYFNYGNSFSKIEETLRTAKIEHSSAQILVDAAAAPIMIDGMPKMGYDTAQAQQVILTWKSEPLDSNCCKQILNFKCPLKINVIT